MAEFELTFPAEESAYLKEVYGSSSTILEYGSGGSTLYAATETTAEIRSIESDKAWAEELNTTLVGRGIDPTRARVEWVNIGETKKWGYPSDNSRWKNYPDYVFLPWDQGFDPDTVLIDGRFRRACFAAVAMLARRDTTVLFDDYSDRETYQQVECLAEPVEIVGRLARFEVTPKRAEGLDFATMIRWFFRPN